MLVESLSTEPSLVQKVEIAKSLFEILAICGGAIWTYFNYFQGRIYKPRLECSIDATIETRSGRAFLLVGVSVRNIGLSKVSIDQKGTALLVYQTQRNGVSPLFPAQVRWGDPVAAFDVFTGNKWAEPSEPIAESMMAALPHSTGALYKVTLKVVSGSLWWTAERIVGDT